MTQWKVHIWRALRHTLAMHTKWAWASETRCMMHHFCCHLSVCVCNFRCGHMCTYRWDMHVYKWMPLSFICTFFLSKCPKRRSWPCHQDGFYFLGEHFMCRVQPLPKYSTIPYPPGKWALPVIVAHTHTDTQPRIHTILHYQQWNILDEFFFLCVHVHHTSSFTIFVCVCVFSLRKFTHINPSSSPSLLLLLLRILPSLSATAATFRCKRTLSAILSSLSLSVCLCILWI